MLSYLITLVLQECDDLLEQITVKNSDLLARLYNFEQHFGLLSWWRSHFLWQVTDSLEVVAVGSVDENWQDIREEGRNFSRSGQNLNDDICG